MDAQGNIHERIESLDENSPDRKELSDEYKNGSEKPLRPKAEAADGREDDLEAFDDF